MSGGDVYELETRLRALGRDVSYPHTPDVRNAVMARIERAPEFVVTGSPSRFRFALVAAVAAAIALIATVGLSPSARQAVADFLGVEGIRIEFDDSAPVEPGETDLQLGSRITLAEAQDAVEFDLAVPAELGEPDAVYIIRYAESPQVSLVWHPRPGLPESAHTGFGAVLTQFEGNTAPEFFKKVAVSETDVTYAQIDGYDAFFVDGAPHVIVRIPSGETRELAPRLAGNTLLWDSPRVTYRLEAEIELGRALEIATSLE